MIAYGLFDKDGRFLIAYPRELLVKVYLSGFSKPDDYSIKEINISLRIKQ